MSGVGKLDANSLRKGEKVRAMLEITNSNNKLIPVWSGDWYNFGCKYAV
jgi:hypothetical protein